MTILASLRTRAALAVIAAALVAAAAPSAQNPYRILITNDDGVQAPGILAIAQALQSVGEITIVAPRENQSGKGHSITILDPIYIDAVKLEGGIPATAATATPASCVKVALRALLKEKPDLVVSGINRGYNLAAVTYVSGTVGAAREAALAGIPAIASSLAVQETNYAPAAQIVKQVVELVRKNGLEPGVFLNVNVPAGPATTIKGIRIARQSLQTGTERFEEQKTPQGRRYFWSVWNEPTGDSEGTDVWAIEQGYATVTPLRIGEFDQKTYERWKDKLK